MNILSLALKALLYSINVKYLLFHLINVFLKIINAQINNRSN